MSNVASISGRWKCKNKKVEWPHFVYISHKPDTCMFFPFVIFSSIKCCIYIPILEMDLIPDHYQGFEFKCGGKKIKWFNPWLWNWSLYLCVDNVMNQRLIFYLNFIYQKNLTIFYIEAHRRERTKKKSS